MTTQLVYSTVLKVTPKAIAGVNGLLAGTIPHDERDGNVMVEWTARFAGGCEADVKLVSGGRTGEDDADLPYLDAVLFDPDGRELACCDAESEKIEGEYQWTVPGGQEDEDLYTLVVEPETEE
jgi:hypothetical protein